MAIIRKVIMKNRFIGDSGRAALVDTLKDQKMVAGNAALAEQIANVSELMDVKTGTAIITQGSDDSDVYLIVAGSFDIIVNGRELRFGKLHYDGILSQ
jgi:CRP/FNR family cyclic AMP-dependent transcriptional regulator